ncbi:ATP-binding protein [Azohydromonas aeria]|uniref:ATP-binding protein n=1 Tax=Azohydromonas aeria TaxID=2590212 RepID=UPI0012F7DD33|nr:ATP-binding protein [Azohydromonas aeria]
MKVHVQVNEQGALRNGRYAFGNRYTVLSELLQNARRAGASAVHVEYLDVIQRLRVTDDGCGIDDFQKLLSLHESGWDEQLANSEGAFGMGFSKCLYAAKSVSVTSRGMTLAFECADALAQAELEVVPAPETDRRKTVVQLDGVELPHLRVIIGRMVRGFPIPVYFNGEPCERSHALDARLFVKTPIGMVHLAGVETGRPSDLVAVYLQGLLVADAALAGYLSQDEVDVIHLDLQRFAARLPDRTELIDPLEARERIDRRIKRTWRLTLLQHKALMAPQDFVDRYYEAARCKDLLEVFDDVDVLPRRAYSLVSAYPGVPMREECDYRLVGESHLHRSDINAGVVRLAAYEPGLKGPNVATLMYAQAASVVLVDLGMLGPNHWVQHGLRDLTREAVTVTAVDVTAEASFRGAYAQAPVRACDHIEIVHGNDKVVLRDKAIFWDGAIFYPRSCRDGQVVMQVSDYRTAQDHVDELACGVDEDLLARFMRKLRCPDPVALLQCVLEEICWTDYPQLSGRRFRVIIGSSDATLTVIQA